MSDSTDVRRVSCFLSFDLIVFQYEELVHYSGSEGMSMGGYGDDVRPLPPPQYGAPIPDSLKHHKDQIYGWVCVYVFETLDVVNNDLWSLLKTV